MKKIALTRNKFALVDEEDFDFLNQWKWMFNGRYASRSVLKDNKKTTIYMHRIINQTPIGLETDHINGNKLDNRKENLRAVTRWQNEQNKPIRSNNTTGFKGIYFNKKTKRWNAYLYAQKKRRQSAHATAQEAAKAYDEMARIYHGEMARLNFPDALEARPNALLP